jgi:hypothetical protein
MVIQQLDLSEVPAEGLRWIAITAAAGFCVIYAQQDGRFNLEYRASRPDGLTCLLLCDRGRWSAELGYGPHEMFDAELWHSVCGGSVSSDVKSFDEQVQFFSLNFGTLLVQAQEPTTRAALARARLTRYEGGSVRGDPTEQ